MAVSLGAISPSTTTGTLASSGIGSGLDVNGIITQLMTVAQRPLTLLANKEASYQAQLSAYGNVKSALANFQTAMSGLSDTSQFQSLSATPSDSSVLTATADGTAAAGSFSIAIDHLAQAQSLVAAGKLSSSAALGSGATTTLSFQFGTTVGAVFTPDASQSLGTVTIDNSNNSLTGIRDAINAAHAGVSATIVNDGGAQPYRLVLTSNTTGARHSMKITASGDATLQSLLAHDPAGAHLTETAAAKDAALTVNGIDITSASNTVSGAIQGVTLNLAKGASSATTLNVAQNTGAVQSAVQSFVSAYNAANKTLTDLSSYDAKSNTAATLAGDRTTLSLQTQLRSVLSSALSGLSGNLTSLFQVGVTMQKDGALALDSAKLQSAIASNFNDIGGLFATVGKPTDSLVSFAGSTAQSKLGSYAVTVSALATHGSIAGSAAAQTTITQGVNDQINFKINGVSATITLPAGIYTADTLAAQLQGSINGNAAFAATGVAVAVTQSSGALTITSNSYGSGSTVTVAGGDGLTDLLGDASVATTGIDVAGTIGGVTATGFGQSLTGATGTAAEGLQLSVAGGITGARGTLNFSQGYASQFNALAQKFLDAKGMIATRTEGINKSITDIGTERTAENLRLTQLQATYRAQFNSLDTLMANLNQTSTFLTQQMASLPSNMYTTNSSK